MFGDLVYLVMWSIKPRINGNTMSTGRHSFLFNILRAPLLKKNTFNYSDTSLIEKSIWSLGNVESCSIAVIIEFTGSRIDVRSLQSGLHSWAGFPGRLCMASGSWYGKIDLFKPFKYPNESWETAQIQISYTRYLIYPVEQAVGPHKRSALW